MATGAQSGAMLLIGVASIVGACLARFAWRLWQLERRSGGEGRVLSDSGRLAGGVEGPVLSDSGRLAGGVEGP